MGIWRIIIIQEERDVFLLLINCSLVFKYLFLGEKGENVGKRNTEKSHWVNISRIHIYHNSKNDTLLRHSSWEIINKINKIEQIHKIKDLVMN